MMVALPPDSVMMSPDFDPVAAAAEYGARLPGLAERFEPEHPGMHTTDTIDYGILMNGEISLELDDRKVAALEPDDVVVQNGTRHAWRNHGNKAAKMIFVLIGANRSEALRRGSQGRSRRPRYASGTPARECRTRRAAVSQ
jgi:hypothetical protein